MTIWTSPGSHCQFHQLLFSCSDIVRGTSAWLPRFSLTSRDGVFEGADGTRGDLGRRDSSAIVVAFSDCRSALRRFSPGVKTTAITIVSMSKVAHKTLDRNSE